MQKSCADGLRRRERGWALTTSQYYLPQKLLSLAASHGQLRAPKNGRMIPNIDLSK